LSCELSACEILGGWIGLTAIFTQEAQASENIPQGGMFCQGRHFLATKSTRWKLDTTEFLSLTKMGVRSIFIGVFENSLETKKSNSAFNGVANVQAAQ
jgi:hypothetical protein